MEYPKIKKVLWRFLRVFVASFIVGASVVLSATSEVAFTSFENFLNILVVPACLAGATAAINAIGKLLREYFGEKSGIVNKLIF